MVWWVQSSIYVTLYWEITLEESSISVYYLWAKPAFLSNPHELRAFPQHFNCPLVSSLKRTAFTTIHQLSRVSETKSTIIKGALVHSWAEFNPGIWEECGKQSCPPVLTHLSCHCEDRMALPQSKECLHQHIHSNPMPGKLPPHKYKLFQEHGSLRL